MGAFVFKVSGLRFKVHYSKITWACSTDDHRCFKMADLNKVKRFD